MEYSIHNFLCHSLSRNFAEGRYGILYVYKGHVVFYAVFYCSHCRRECRLCLCKGIPVTNACYYRLVRYGNIACAKKLGYGIFELFVAFACFYGKFYDVFKINFIFVK